jgi:lipopolysaccharide exporter
MINTKGELFTTALCFFGISVIKLGSSMVLTRILYPEAYGIVTMLTSIVFIIEMLSDVGIVALVIRHERGEDPRYLNTMWTVRFVRSCINCAALFILAPFLADWYDSPALAGALRIFSIWFVLFGLESMSFVLAIRRKETRIINYTDLFATFVSTLFSIVYSYFSRDYVGIIYGMLLNRLLTTVISYRFYRDVRPRLVFDKLASKDLFEFAKYVMPSSMITLVLNQFDKVIFLKLFNLQLLGLYGLATNISGPVDALVAKISRTVLYARCAENFRIDPGSFVNKYYTENIKLFAVVLLLPASVCGAAHFIVDLLFDDRYLYAGVILQAFAFRSILFSFASTAEDVLVASGRTHVVLIGNVIRLVWFIPAVLLGNHFFGFEGFIYLGMLESLPTMVYFFVLQHRNRLLIARYELLKLGFVAVVGVSSWLVSTQLLHLLHAARS